MSTRPTAGSAEGTNRLKLVLQVGHEHKKADTKVLLVPTPQGPAVVPVPAPGPVDPGLWQNAGKPVPGLYEPRKSFPRALWSVLSELPSKTDPYGNVLEFELVDGKETLRSIAPFNYGGVVEFSGASGSEYPTLWRNGLDRIEFSGTEIGSQKLASMDVSFDVFSKMVADIPPPLYEDMRLASTGRLVKQWAYICIKLGISRSSLTALTASGYTSIVEAYAGTRITIDKDVGVSFVVQTGDTKLVYRPITNEFGRREGEEKIPALIVLKGGSVVTYMRSPRGSLDRDAKASVGKIDEFPKYFPFKTEAQYQAEFEKMAKEWAEKFNEKVSDFFTFTLPVSVVATAICLTLESCRQFAALSMALGVLYYSGSPL